MKFELIMNGQPYTFNFGMGFLKTINSKATTKATGTNYTVNTGARLIMAQVMSNDVEALCEVLMIANKGEEPRLNQNTLYSFIEDEDTDLDAVFAQVVDFFEKANATKMVYREIREIEEEEKKK